MFNPIAVAMVMAPVAILIVRGAIKPPAPKTCGSVSGPPVTSPRVKLSDGRHLAYREFGVPKEEARYKIIVAHGYGESKDKTLAVSQELIEDMGIYFLFFDRAGYGESDPNPSRSVKSEAYDIQELADRVQLGQKFYIIGISMGGCVAWSCLHYIPHRLLGAALVVPFVNYWWPSLPNNLLRDSLRMLPKPDQWTLRVAHYAPWLLHWWKTQKWFPSLTVLNLEMFPHEDLEILKSLPKPSNTDQEKITQQGKYESLHRDFIVGYGNWEFGPIEITNPFPHNEGYVHIWQGLKDRIIPYAVNRYIADKLPWIHYHELSDVGHLFILRKNECESVIRALLLS